jgi:hypothetical protein
LAHNTFISPKLLAGMMEASGEEDDDDEEFEDEEYGEDGEEPEMPELSAGTEEEDNAEEEDAWDAAPAPAVATNAIRHAWNRAGRRAANPATQQQTQQQQTLQQQQLGFSVAVPLLMPQQWQRPSGCSLLQRGVTFEGWQRLSTQTGSRRREEQWTVSVVIQVRGEARLCTLSMSQWCRHCAVTTRLQALICRVATNDCFVSSAQLASSRHVLLQCSPALLLLLLLLLLAGRGPSARLCCRHHAGAQCARHAAAD